VPLSLLFYANRILNPAVVLIEVFLFIRSLHQSERRSGRMEKGVSHSHLAAAQASQSEPPVLASLQPGWIRPGIYVATLPLILLQAAGWRRPVRFSWLIGLPFGTGLGVLYSNDHLRTAFGDFVQQSRLGQKRVSGRSRIGSRGSVERDRGRVLPGCIIATVANAMLVHAIRPQS
jgi:hypothetical protein